MISSYTEELWTHTFQHLHETINFQSCPTAENRGGMRMTMREWEGLIDNIHELVRQQTVQL